MHRFSHSASQFALISVLALASLPSAAQAEESKEPPKWDVSAPPGMTIREVPIAVDEGIA